MIKPRIKILAMAVGLLVTVSSAKFLPYPERSLKYPTEQGWETDLNSHWTYWKSHFLSGGLVTATDPSGTSGNVSEAQGYGMLLALWFNDRATFNTIWAATETNFWNASCGSYGWYGWKLSFSQGTCGGQGSYAPDADQDITGALIFASALVDSGYWDDYTVTATGGTKYNYKQKAKQNLQSIYTSMVDQSHSYQMNSWHDAEGKTGIRNPSYHMPAWDSVYQEFAKANGLSSELWSSVRAGAYALFNAQPNYASGMARNFSNSSGGTPDDGTSSPNNYDMGFDAIRVPYRIGLDGIWYRYSKAIAWCKSVWNNSVVNPDSAGMYTISTLKLYGWSTGSDSKYELAMPTAMWGTCAVSVQDSSTKGYLAAGKLVGKLSAGVTNHNYFLLTSNSDTTTSSAPNKNYYAQTLSLLGALAMDGRAWNVWDDLKNKWTAPDTLAKVSTALTATPSSIASLSTAVKLTAKFSHSINWIMTMTGSTSGLYKYSGSADSINVTWTPSTNKIVGKSFVLGETVTAQIWYSDSATKPSGTNSATITLSTASGLSETRTAHLSALSWTSAGLRLPAGLVESGESYDVRVMDLMGRQQGASRTAVARTSGDGEILDLAPQHMDKAGFVEVRSAGGARVQLLLPPVR